MKGKLMRMLLVCLICGGLAVLIAITIDKCV